MQLAEGEQLRSDLSCTLFLNDPGDYEGGRLIVSDTFGEHDIALPAGDAILYPSRSLHRVEPVTRGARLASFFWIQSLVRDHGPRQMLFAMDTAIQTLTLAAAEHQSFLHHHCASHPPPQLAPN